MINKLGESYISHTPGGELTFVGILREYYEIISSKWNEETQKKYTQDYNERLLPALGPLKPMRLYEEDDFIDVLSVLRRSYRYNEERMNHFMNLIWKVYITGVEQGLYPDKLNWKNMVRTGGNKGFSGSGFKKQILRKSFTIQEERKLLEWFSSLDPITALGEEIGLAIMLFSGLRNQEACGLDFSGLRLLGRYNNPCIVVFQTTKKDNNEIKAGGKTGNAMRIIPAFDFLYEFLEERRKYIEENIAGRDGSQISVDGMPVVCKGLSYSIRGQSSDLSAFANKLFEKLGIRKAFLLNSKTTVFHQKLAEVNIEEKDATTYICRRNFATHLYSLGFSESEIQYLIGHDIESSSDSRNFLGNEDNIMVMKLKMDQHPYRLYFKHGVDENEISDSNVPYISYLNADETLILKADNKKIEFKIEVDAEEPMDSITISSKSNIDKASMVLGSKINGSGYGYTVNVRNLVNKNYERILIGNKVKGNKQRLG